MTPAPQPFAPTPLLPTSEDEVCAFVREATRSRRPLAPIGSGTKRHLGPALTAETTALSLRRLDQITSYEPGDMVVSVQAGVRLAHLQRVLGERGQWLPIDPPHAEATIGGVLASASAGPRRLGYGTVRDQLLGLRVVGAAGVVTKSGGRVVKNVTGYDVHKLHVGAFGTLGILVEAHLKVRPRPEISGAIVFGCESFPLAHRLLLEVWASALRPVALDAVSVGAAACLRDLAPGLPGGEALAVVGVEASGPVFERHVRELQALRGRARAMAVLRGPDCEALWSGFRNAPERRQGDVTVRIGARPQDLPTLLGELSVEDRTGTGIWAHAASGIARVQMHAEDAPEIARRVRGWHERATARAGYAVVESAPPQLPGRAELPFAGVPQALFATVKRQWDPEGIFNPGRNIL